MAGPFAVSARGAAATTTSRISIAQEAGLQLAAGLGELAVLTGCRVDGALEGAGERELRVVAERADDLAHGGAAIA